MRLGKNQKGMIRTWRDSLQRLENLSGITILKQACSGGELKSDALALYLLSLLRNKHPKHGLMN